MRKTISLLFSFILIFFFSFTIVKAECSYAKQSELNALASNVKYSVEPKEEILPIPGVEAGPDDTYINTTFSLQLLNLTEDMKVNLYNDFSKSTTSYTYNDVKDGILEINSGTGDQIVKFKVDIYGMGECGTQLLRTFEVKTPMVNPYKNYGFCDNVTDYYLCQDYLVEDPKMTSYEASIAVKKYSEQKEIEKEQEIKKQKTFLQMIGSFLKQYGILMFLGLLIVGLIVVIIIRKNKGRRII